MIGYHITTEGIASSTGEICLELPYLDWLVERECGILYDLDAGAAALLRLIGLTKEEGQKLWDRGKLYLAPYRITYYPGRFLSIDRGFGRGHKWVHFCDASQYQPAYYDSSDPLIADMTAHAISAESTGNRVALTFEDLRLPTNSLVSPISAFSRGHMDKLDLPQLHHLPAEVVGLAQQCVKGSWFEAYQVGYWEEAWDYDINGAYAYELANLLDLRRGEWLNSRDRPDGAIYGFAQGRLETWADIHPFLVKGRGDNLYTPVGHWDTVLTLQEIDFLRHWELGNFEVRDAWWWVATEQHQPYRGIVKWLWAKRKDADPFTKSIIKRILSGIWGKMLEVRSSGYGPYYNPVYGAIVESNTRLRVAGTCLINKATPLHIALDGMILGKPIPFDWSEELLGAWRLSHQGQCIIISSGIVGMEGKANQEEFSIGFDWLRSQIATDPNIQEYPMTKWTPVTLGQALAWDEWDKLGEVRELVRTVHIGQEPKRIWKDTPTSGQSILNWHHESAPWTVGIITHE